MPTEVYQTSLFENSIPRQDFRCVDCATRVSTRKTKRCRPCAAKLRAGVNNLRWTGGLPLCVDCGKQLSAYNVKRCQPCYHKTKAGENHPMWRGGGKRCIDCKGHTKTRGSQALRCWQCHIDRDLSKANSHRWQPERHLCADCGKELALQNKGRSTRCRDCYFKQKPFTGDRNPNWKGGISDRTGRYLSRVPLSRWRRAVFVRDGYQCRICSYGQNLHAHHILRWTEYEELRFEVNNGVTLCDFCHLHVAHRGRWRNDPVNLWPEQTQGLVCTTGLR